MGEQLYLERFVWFDNEARRERFPNATIPGVHFQISPKTAQRFIYHLFNLLQAPLEYDPSRKGYYYTDLTFQLLSIRNPESSWYFSSLTQRLPLAWSAVANRR